MAQIPNTRALTESDGLNTIFNVDTQNKIIGIANGAKIVFYSDELSTSQVQVTGTGTAPVVSATAPALASSGTIATSGVGVTRVTPATAVTGVIMAAGSVNGQSCIVINEATAANTIQMAASGTSNVADGANCVIDGLQEKRFTWDSATSLWYANTDTVNGALNSVMSATTPDPGAGGTIATSGVGVALVTPAAARTGIILAPGTINGEEIWVVNQGAAANTLTLNTTPATANVADSATEAAIAGLTARKYVWVGGSTNLWYPAK